MDDQELINIIKKQQEQLHELANRVGELQNTTQNPQAAQQQQNPYDVEITNVTKFLQGLNAKKRAALATLREGEADGVEDQIMEIDNQLMSGHMKLQELKVQKANAEGQAQMDVHQAQQQQMQNDAKKAADDFISENKWWNLKDPTAERARQLMVQSVGQFDDGKTKVADVYKKAAEHVKSTLEDLGVEIDGFTSKKAEETTVDGLDLGLDITKVWEDVDVTTKKPEEGLNIKKQLQVKAPAVEMPSSSPSLADSLSGGGLTGKDNEIAKTFGLDPKLFASAKAITGRMKR